MLALESDYLEEEAMSHGKSSGALGAALLVASILIQVVVPSAWAAGEYKTLQRFKINSPQDGLYPLTGLIIDSSGDIYGTTSGGGAYGDYGTVFRLAPNGDNGWTESVLHSFNGQDGDGPGKLIFDAAGNLYGTASSGGAFGYGAVFQMTTDGDGSWTESVLYSFNNDSHDGIYPAAGLIFDQAGNLYGTTTSGGAFGISGVVFRLNPSGDGRWTESVLHSFSGKDGWGPYGELIFDGSGNLYDTTYGGGAHDGGTVFKLAPNADGSWTETLLHSFNNRRGDGSGPVAGLIFDSAGNLLGTTREGGFFGSGTVFRLAPRQDGSWAESVLHAFNPVNDKDGGSPYAPLVLDQAGNLYGTTSVGGSDKGYGTIFMVRPTTDGGWREIVLHSFVGTPGKAPTAGLVLDGQGTLYGTTAGDHLHKWGSVFEITP